MQTNIADTKHITGLTLKCSYNTWQLILNLKKTKQNYKTKLRAKKNSRLQNSPGKKNKEGGGEVEEETRWAQKQTNALYKCSVVSGQ